MRIDMCQVFGPAPTILITLYKEFKLFISSLCPTASKMYENSEEVCNINECIR